ncbi:hypothetical protein TYRP_014151 [Tyrophagus putrescentiae]|nr:hypothetical protein TYRP_014151 [Tyrophagus putrescentiae]
MNTLVSPHLIARFTEAKEDFKVSMCRQVDALFATFLEQIQPSGLQLVTMGQPHQSQLHQPQAPHQTFTVGGQQILLTSAASADQTLADIIAGGADSDLLHHLMPVGGSGASANTPQTITINHFGTGNATTWETIQTADGSQLLATSNANASAEQSQAPPQSSQPPPKQSGGKRKNSNMPTATKTSTVATKSRPPPTATNIRVIPETTAFSLSAPGQAGSSGTISLVPIVVSTSTNAHHHQMQTTMQTLPGAVTYQLPLQLQPSSAQPPPPPAPQSTATETDQPSTSDAPQETVNWADLESECECSECEDQQSSSAGQQESTSTNGDKVPGTSRPKKIKTENASGSGNPSALIFPCPVASCSLVFHRRHQLRDHRLTSHSGMTSDDPSSKSFACRHRDCGKVFQSPNHLRRHECIHTNVRPYRCKWDSCNFVAIQRSDAIRHVRVKHWHLPRTFKLQQEMNIEDTRDPLEFIEVNR